MASRFKQGSFIPKNKEKYLGEISKIFYRSSYELKFMHWADQNPSVLKWNSEGIIIPYIKPTDNKSHRYYMDFYLEYKNTKGQLIKECIEIKPYAQTRAPRKTKKPNLYEQVSYAVNIAKWKAASKWCNQRGISFRILTEKELFK